MRNNRLKQWRHTFKMSQLALSVESKVGPSMVVAIERYGYFPGPKVRAKLTKALGITEAALWPDLAEAKEETQ